MVIVWYGNSPERSFKHDAYKWEEATYYDKNKVPNEVHISGDMNIDFLNQKWLEPSYSLVSLGQMICNICNAHNFHQLVKDVT